MFNLFCINSKLYYLTITILSSMSVIITEFMSSWRGVGSFGTLYHSLAKHKWTEDKSETKVEEANGDERWLRAQVVKHPSTYKREDENSNLPDKRIGTGEYTTCLFVKILHEDWITTNLLGNGSHNHRDTSHKAIKGIGLLKQPEHIRGPAAC